MKHLEDIMGIMSGEMKEIYGPEVASLEPRGSQLVVEVDFDSNTGECISFFIPFDGTWADFVSRFHKQSHDFDANDHAKEWLTNGGVPEDKAAEIIHDAEEIAKYLKNCAAELDAIKDKYDDEWYLTDKYAG